MNKNLLIIGAGVYGLVAKEIAESMKCFDNISFIDDNAEKTPDGIKVIGKFDDIKTLSCEYANIIVAIGNPEARLSLIQKIEEETPFKIITLISPLSYISPSAQIMKGCIVEPMAVVHTGCVVGVGCIISAGAVVNHVSVCGDGVHVDCNATVAGYSLVPAGMKIGAGTVFYNGNVSAGDLFLTSNNCKLNASASGPANTGDKPMGESESFAGGESGGNGRSTDISTGISSGMPQMVDGQVYCFEDGM